MQITVFTILFVICSTVAVVLHGTDEEKGIFHKLHKHSWRSVRVTQNEVIPIKGSTPHAIIKMKILLGS